jgi:CubicO group peptidase (beta-lactamase class C family)
MLRGTRSTPCGRTRCRKQRHNVSGAWYGRRRRVFGSVIAAIAIIGTGYIGAMIGPFLSIGLAYKAKTLCSETFVSGRPLGDVLADLTIDDLRPLRVIRGQIDRGARVSTARFLTAERMARFDDDLGCALEPPAPDAEEGPQQTLSIRPRRSYGEHGGTPASMSVRQYRALELLLDEAFSEADVRRPKRTRAVVVVHRGEIVAERYAPGIRPETPLIGWSMTKSVLNALVGIAIREGKLTLDGPTSLRAWSDPGDARGRITVSDLLRMSSGLAFDEDQGSASSDIFSMLYGAPDMAGFASSKRLIADPGSVWSYSSGSSLILSRLLRERLGDEAYRVFPRKALFEPLGFTKAVLEADATGTFVASSYMYATARDWARFGQLYLQNGVWQDQRILPEGWVEYTRTPAPADSLAAYGAHFWLSTPMEYQGPAVRLPADVFHAVGHEAQFVTIVPSHDVVVVRLGKTRYPGSWEHDRFVAAVLAAIEIGTAGATRAGTRQRRQPAIR